MPSLSAPDTIIPEIISFFNKKEKPKLFVVKKNLQCEKNSQDFTNYRPQKDFSAQNLTVCFNDLLLSESTQKVPEITNLALLHGVYLVHRNAAIHGEASEIFPMIMSSKSFTTFTLLSVDAAKQHCFSNFKQESHQMKNTQASSGNNDDGESSCLPSVEPYEELHDEDVYECLEEELDAEIFNQLYTENYQSQVLKRMEHLKRFFEESDQSVLQAEDIPDELIGIEDRLIGCVTYFRYAYDGYPNAKKGLEVRSMSVRKSYQGCGVGRSLMEDVNDLLRDGLVNCITIISVDDAIPFYRKLGWKLINPDEGMILYRNDSENTEESSVFTDDVPLRVMESIARGRMTALIED